MLAEEAGGQVTWLLADRQGSITDTLDNSGALSNYLVYNSYGQVVDQQNPSANLRYRYTGRKYDSESGLYYNRARYYDPAAGRFISQDPKGFEAGDANLYRYVGNSPAHQHQRRLAVRKRSHRHGAGSKSGGNCYL